MPVPLPRHLVDAILLGPGGDRRQLQESPILGDVWAAFAKDPGASHDLLIEPYKLRTAGEAAMAMADGLSSFDEARRDRVRTGTGAAPADRATGRNVAYLQGIVAARLSFDELLCVVVPATNWWSVNRLSERLEKYGEDEVAAIVDRIVAAARELGAGRPDAPTPPSGALERFLALAGIVSWAAVGPTDRAGARRPRRLGTADDILGAIRGVDVAARFLPMLARMRTAPGTSARSVWQVSLNRPAAPALDRSVPAVKADAARTLFGVRCDRIAWAVLDSGIDAGHPAFQGANGCRVRRAFDFSRIRRIVSLERPTKAALAARLDELLHRDLKHPMTRAEAGLALVELGRQARAGRAIQWEIVERFVEVVPGTAVQGVHGTHVAGILGGQAWWGEDGSAFPAGMCPEIDLLDMRVLSRTNADTEFAVIAALQYLRHLNERHNYLVVHGANLSLSIPHDVRNFACGRTPVCNECERLVDGGVVVVAAAGNRGYHSYETSDGPYEGYAAFSVTDPGNADGVVTVGSTHRYSPHTYGVSFFSSRGPTGDGRLKPDLVAPGERIEGPLPGAAWGQQDGTSMAAPHVSGAAAMLMARYSELIGQPRRVKQIICRSATDLGRERSFQGNGMLDVLRAFQSI